MALKAPLPRRSATTPPAIPSKGLVLAVESGATSTVAILADAKAGRVIARMLSGPLEVPGSFTHLIQRLLRHGRVGAGGIRRAVICMAGISKKNTANMIRRECRALGLRCKPILLPDIFSTLAAALGDAPGIVIVAGTGSCVLGQDARGFVKRCGGWGERLGDEGSAYAIGREALRMLLQTYDGIAEQSAFTKAIAHAIRKKGLPELLAWAHAAAKKDIAALAPVLIAHAKKGDARARKVIDDACKDLARQCLPIASWLTEHGKTLPIILAGGLLENRPLFAEKLCAEVLAQGSPGQHFSVQTPGVKKAAGALRLALGEVRIPRFASQGYSAGIADIPATESANPHSKGIDTRATQDIVRILLHEDITVPHVVLSQLASLAKAVDTMVASLRRGGRIFYVGAGTSGRLAALDATELPPTFGVPSGLFETLLAGGPAALTGAVEGAEDDAGDGQKQVRDKKISGIDVVVGIAASGSTPFVLSAVKEAKRSGAKTIAVTCNPATPLEKICELAIVACVGPEVIAGSTRMKAGTATKLILNTLSTATMIRLGKVYDHWMVDVLPSNKKLRARAARIVAGITGRDIGQGRAMLERAQGETKVAIVMERAKASLQSARELLRRNGGNLRKALGMSQ